MFYYFISKSRKVCADVPLNCRNPCLFNLNALFTIPHTALKVFIYDVISALSKNKRPY